MTKSATATPGVSDLAVKTVKMEGSYNKELVVFFFQVQCITLISNLRYDQMTHY